MDSQGRAKSDEGCDQKMPSSDSVSEKLALPEAPSPPPRQTIPQSDSGICLTPLSQTSVLSPQRTEAVGEVSEERSGAGGAASHADPTAQNSSPAPSASAVSHHGGSIAGQDVQSPTSDHGGLVSPRPSTSDQDGAVSPRPSKSSSSTSPDDFTNQTKYLVLHFLHHSTAENNFLPCLSTTSESEPRCKSYAERLRRQWQRNRSQSSPTSPHLRTRRKPAKLKGSRSSPDLKDANFFKDVPPQRKHKPRRPSPPKPPPRCSRKSSALTKLRPAQTVAAASLIRSVSENTENSETGTYLSDADDELDTSFDSSLQGSTTSASFRNKLVHFHRQAFRSSLPTVQSETESVTEVPLSVAEESLVDPGSPLPIMDVSAVEHQPVLTADQLVRVTNYLHEMRESRAGSSADVPQARGRFSPASQNVEEEERVMETDPPESFLPQPAGPVQLSDQIEDGTVSGGFEPNSTSVCFPDETDGAWGGMEESDVLGAEGGDTEFGRRGDRSGLRLEICDQDAVVLIEVVHSLRQEIEEEISSFESELEEAHQAAHSTHWHTLSPSQSVSPETAEIARQLARIGDDVQHKYFDHLDRAVGRLFLDNCAGLFTYENFREAALMALAADVHGWQQVATVLLYSQHVALHLAQSGRHVLHRLVDFTVRLLADTAATFIINQGGWASISAMDRNSSSSSSPEPSGVVAPTFHSLGHDPGSIGALHPSPSTPDSRRSQSRRSLSAPDLHTAAPSGESRTPTGTMTSAGPSTLGQASASALALAATSASAVQVNLPLQASPPGPKGERDGGGRGHTEEQETDGKSAEPGEGEGEGAEPGEGEGEGAEPGEGEGEGAEPGDGEGEGSNGADEGGGGGAVSGVSPTAVLTGCAVSVALIGVGLAVALNLIRG